MNILDFGIDYGTITTINFSTIINRTGNGYEQRLSNWDEPLLSFEIGNRNLDNEEINYLQTFFDARKGSFQTFLVKDWSDYYAVNQQLNINEGLNYQLYKTYAVNSDIVNRIITKPKVNTVEIFIDGVQQLSGWLVDNLTGVITFDVAPAGLVTANFEFYVPVRFVQDKIDYKFLGIKKNTDEKIYSLERLSLLEARETPTINWINTNQGNYNFIIDLGYDYETLGGEAYNTKINQVASGFESRRQDWLDSQGSWDIGQRKLNLAELWHLIAAFRLCQGQFGSFFYKDWKDNKNQLVRFGEDNINFRFDAINTTTQEVIFNLAGVLINKLLFPNTYIVPLYNSSGITEAALSTINAALNQFKTTLQTQNYYGSEDSLNKFFKSNEIFLGERYLQAVALDHRVNPLDANKYRFLLFIDEANFVYHSNPRNIELEPNALWLTDYAAFQDAFLTYESFDALIIVPYDNTVSEVVSFEEHLNDAINGLSDYANYALKRFNFSYQTISINASVQDYYNLLSDWFGI